MGDEIKSAVDIAMSGERPPIQHDETKIPELSGTWESQGSSQTNVDLSKFNEALNPTTNTVVENWETNMSNSPSIVVATEDKTSPTPTVETRDLHQEALDSNKKANEGFVSGPMLSNTGRSFFENEDIYAENARLKEEIAELKVKLGNNDADAISPQDPRLQYALNPDKPKSADQLEVDQAYATINKDLNQKALNEIDQIKAMLEPKTPPVTPSPTSPELTNTTAVEAAEKENRERNYRRAALIAGVVVGGTGGVLGGTPVAGVGALACVGAGLLNRGLDYVGSRRIGVLQQQLALATDPQQRASLEKRISNWEKVRKGSEYVKQFLMGAGIGFAASGLAMGIFNGGHGLIWNKPEIPVGIPSGAENGISKAGIEQPAGTETPLPGSPETYPGNSFIHDGRVNLPGSAWDGNMAGGPAQDTLTGGAENFANYSGGPSEMAANQLGQDLASNNITDELLSNLTTYDKHRLLTEYWNAIRAGNANPELVETLKSMGTDGAQKLLAAIGK